MKNKYIISFLLLFVLLFSISTFAFAYRTDPSKIQPDLYFGSEIIIGNNLFDYHEPNYYQITYNPITKTTILYPVYIPPVEEQTTTTNNNTEPVTQEDNTPQEGSYAPTKLAEDIFILVNQARMDAELNTVSYNNKELQETADLRAKEITEKFAHDRPDGTSCFTAFPKDYVLAGENIIQADEPIATANNLMKSWMDSEGHKANILNPDFTTISIGVYEKDEVIYVAQLFIG